MKNQTIVLIVLGCVLGVAVATGMGLMVVWLMRDSAPPPVAWGPGGPANVPMQNLPRFLDDDIFDGDPPPFNVPFNVPQEQPLPPENVQAARGEVVAAKDYRLSGPFTHENLTVYLIHGPSTLKDRQVLTLQEALNQNLAVVHETGTGVLSIDNRGQAPLFIQAGDIVKGGTQDRVLPYDQLIPPQTERQPLVALCVEQGRSSPRGFEVSTSFSQSTEQLPSKALKMSAYRRDQGAVWSNVRNLQTKLSGNLGSVTGNQSPTSLQLTLENPRVQEKAGMFQEKLAGAVDGKNDVIGCVVAINGKIHGADVYASQDMFQKLWPKLLRASSVEALAEQQAGTAGTPPSTDAVQAFLSGAENGPAYQQDPGRGVRLLRQEGQNLLLDTCDTTRDNLVLHRSVLAK